MPPDRPSITTWTRLEPRPRTTDFSEALAARVRDPAWFLARQWQLGEFVGEDGGSPAYIRVEAQVGRLTAWGVGAGNEVPRELDHRAPVEAYVTAEPFAMDDLALSVELGQAFDRAAARHGSHLRDAFLAAYPVPAGASDEEPRTSRLRSLWRGRAIDGLALWRASSEPPPPIPPGTAPSPPVAGGVPWSVAPDQRAAAAAAVEDFRTLVLTTYGAPDDGDPAGWRPESLDYALRVYATDPNGAGVAVLDAKPDRRGDMDWYAFDHVADVPSYGALDTTREVVQQAVIPAPVRFRGMPNRRFWDFEDARFDLAAVRTDPRGLASMLLLDFTLIHGNDWYLVPFELPVGTLSASTVRVVDVFGETHEVPPASTTASRTDPRFTMYSLSGSLGLSHLFALPVSAATSVLEGPPLEQVRFLRDEVANLVWAVEHIVEGGLGRGERSADRPPPPPPAAPAAAPGASLRYRIQSPVPSHWIPFQAVAIRDPSNPTREEVALERAKLLSLSGGAPNLPAVRGKVLAPSLDGRYRIREEQVPREGTRVTRLIRRARGADGTTHVWTARTRGVGTGEGSSGLAFDQALFADQAPHDDET